jgi:DNA mismatch repair protein MutS
MSEPISIYSDYIRLTKEYQSKYGPRTVVLLQVGAFFEVYGFKSAEFDEIQDTPIVEFSQVCNLNISEKKIVFEGRQVYMAGFRDYTLDKYLQKLTEGGMTAVVFVQEKENKQVTRVFDSVHSAGTFVSYETENSSQMTNHIMCIWIDIHKPITKHDTLRKSKTRNTISCGVSIVNIYTGSSFLTEFQEPMEFIPTTFDELERCNSIYNPCEVILISSLSPSEIKSVFQFSGIQHATIHTVDLTTSEKAKKCIQQKYIQHILSTFYEKDILNQCSEFTTYPTSTQSFCYLLNYIQEQNPNLVKKIAIPNFQCSDKVLLANHTLKQLNILGDDSVKKGSLGSVSEFLNKCCTAIGRRKFQSQLVSPTTDIEWLNLEYEMTDLMLGQWGILASIRKTLGKIRDIEKICRQILVRKIYPVSIYHLYESVLCVKQLVNDISVSKDILRYLDPRGSILENVNRVLDFLDSVFFMDICNQINSVTSFDEVFIKPGVSDALDQALAKYNENLFQFDKIQGFLNTLMRKNEKPGDTTEYVKKHETEKSGVTLQITKKRGQTLKTLLQKMPILDIPDTDIRIDPADIKCVSASGSADEIQIPVLSNIIRDIFHHKDLLQKCSSSAYSSILSILETEYYANIESIAKFIALFDVLQCKAYIAREYHYCRPSILIDSENSFVQARKLRHCLIEHINQNEIYVPNDICLGTNETGILLYGTNAVGKTSLIRALGVSIIMAQAGLYVPCSEFLYKPYSAIFSRIVGNDNLFKGLSTFAVEMSELRIILKMADHRSLVLGDELCSGTETESALSIFMAGLQYLYRLRSSFIFATHFHEIVKFDELKEMPNMALKHMAVIYDRELDALVYDRRLLDGPGNRMYGLEVCKSLHLDDDFLDQAYRIRSKYFTKGELDHSPSVYNASKIKGICELCKSEMGEEIHHLEPQVLSDKDGFIGTFHKNHPANLLTVCSKCHDSFHSKNEKNTVLIRKKTTKGYRDIIMDPNIP